MNKAYYIICVNGYEIDGIEFFTGQIEWKPKECRPIINSDWRKATTKEVDKWLYKTSNYDMRKN